MKTIHLICLFVFASASAFAQKSEDFIPVDAVTVFSINNFSLLQKISLDDLVKYEFMQELQQELFDGSTSGKTIKESGIDFNQKLNVFYGKNEKYEIAGFTFGIKDQTQLFTVFDDFDEQVPPMPDMKYYSSYFNHLIIKNNIGLLLRVDPNNDLVRSTADSIWYAQGYSSRQKYRYDYWDEEGYEEIPVSEIDVPETLPKEEIEKEEDVYDVDEELEEIEDGEEYILPKRDISRKNYNELRDSVRLVYNQKFLNQITNELYVQDKNLRKVDKEFANQLEHKAEGVFYLDNGRNVMKTQPFGFYSYAMPGLMNQMKSLYADNKLLGDIRLNNTSIEVQMNANYGEALGSIYKDLNDTKFDKNFTKYIHKDNSAYFTYNIDLKKAYESAYDIIMPILREEKSRYASGYLLSIELMNAFMNKDAIFDTYKGGMFGTFNGVKKVPVTRLKYSYDEDFNFKEIEQVEEEEVPIFTLGFSTKRNDLPALFMEQMAKMNSEWQNKGNYWIIENAVLNSLPMYVINKNDLFIMTNDENLAINHSDGFGANKISSSQIRKTKKSGFVYGEVDWSKTIDNMPRKFLSTQQTEMLNAIRSQSGKMTLTSTNTTASGTAFNLVYDFNGSYENPGKYVLDMVNSLYIIMK